jgi:probable rRNA maturation factor
MSVTIEVATDDVPLPMSRRRVVEVARAVLRAERVRDATVSITFVSNRRIATLNRRHLGHRGPTDVISFALGSDPGGAPLQGDVYIAPAVARRNADVNAVTAREELTRLVVHGVLHVLGFDHPEGPERTASPMWRRQESLLQTLRQPARARATR